ncbi:MAG: MBL fold metallo-hydrolase [SAR86 cluster bacterium]|nr:MBL fold metallo-hydrolase [SAR86 cluster bacterium]
MKKILLTLLFSLYSSFALANPESLKLEVSADSLLREKQWIHGAEDCEVTDDPAIEVYRYDHDTYVLRQSKCLSFEAPFMFLLLGTKTALLIDSGATKDVIEFPLYDTVRSLAVDREILLIHSHNHGDHKRGDAQFEGKSGVTIVEPSRNGVDKFFGFTNWPYGESLLDLGGRELIILPTPGHQEEAITVYDPKTQWLLTGDTVYPGYIYIKDWQAYQLTIKRLVLFAQSHTVSSVLGSHIEMTSSAGQYYPIGTTFQPEEASLVLDPVILLELNNALDSSDKPSEIQLDELIVSPMNFVQRGVSNIARWLTQ